MKKQYKIFYLLYATKKIGLTHTPIQNIKRVVKIKNDNLLKNIKVTFVDLPPYSPDLNIVEYWIHLMRLKFVHNSPKLKLETIKENIRRFMNNNLFLQKESISNIIERIFKICAGEI